MPFRLVDAAAEAGAEIREGFTVEEVLTEDGRVTGVRGHGQSGGTVTERARVVIGADGRHSLVARAVRPEQYHKKPQLLAGYYTYWSGLPMEGRFETYIRPDRGFGAWPTNDDLTVVIAGWPFAEFDANKHDIEGNYLRMLELAPQFADRVRAATREARYVGTAVLNYFRKPYGPGWALVGDAGYLKDFITGHGIHDAFRDAELTTQLATLEPPPPELQQLLAAVHGNQEAMDGFARVIAGVTSPAEFFSEENVGQILATRNYRMGFVAGRGWGGSGETVPPSAVDAEENPCPRRTSRRLFVAASPAVPGRSPPCGASSGAARLAAPRPGRPSSCWSPRP